MMELRDASTAGGWHPFSSALRFDYTEIEEFLYLLPMIDPPSPATFSTILHEVTHQWCARTTRFGWLLHAFGARAFAQWRRDGRPVPIAETMRRLLGAYVPLLEGMAIYSQLDYVAEKQLEPVFSPLTQLQHMFQATRIGHSPLKNFFLAVRDSVIDDGLARMLFFDARHDRASCYFWGYLFVKAMQCRFARFCSAFGEPSLFLPVMIRLVCDWPKLDQIISSGCASSVGLFNELSSDLLALEAGDLELIARHVHAFAPKPEFDTWQIWAQCKNRDRSEPILADETTVTPYLFEEGSVEDHWLQAFRSRASLHIAHWEQGILSIQDESRIGISTSRGDKEVMMLPLSNFFDPRNGRIAMDEYAPADLIEATDFMRSLEEHFQDALRLYEDEEITLAKVFTVTNVSIGAALWHDNRLVSHYLITPQPLFDESNLLRLPPGPLALEYVLLLKSLEVSPIEICAFQAALGNEREIMQEVKQVCQSMAEYLSSDASARRLLNGHRFRCVRTGLAEALRWASFTAPPIELPGQWVAELGSMLDLPRFNHNLPQGAISVRDILPTRTWHVRRSNDDA
jgi:hypothetical protein